MKVGLTRALLLGAFLLAASTASAVPDRIPYVGQLSYTGSGAPYQSDGVVIDARIYPSPTETVALWSSDPIIDVPVIEGVFSIVLEPGASPMADVVMGATELWLELDVDGTTLSPRQRILTVPYAIEAYNATRLGEIEADLYLLSGDDIEVGNLTTTGYASIGGAVRIGSSAEWAGCDSSTSGVIRYDVSMGALLLCDGAGWKLLIDESSQVTTIDWDQVGNKPAGFADGIDNDTIITYAAGLGLTLTDTTFAVDPSVVQQRVSTVCPMGQALVQINQDGTAVCAESGTTVVLSAVGGLVWNGTTELSLRLDCNSGEVLKYNGTEWACAADDSGLGTIGFPQVTGTASDEQIPDNITVLYASDADTVDGHHYSPVWDSTDAATLGGNPPEHFATAADLAALQNDVEDIVDGSFTPPGVEQAICANSMPSKICKRDVWVVGQTVQDADSYALLSGGTWVYNSAENRCEYQGGSEHDAPELCGQDLMPDWMDTSDNCGGFRQSTWDSRVRFAVAKDNIWDKDFEYTCPAGYHWATTEEAQWMFNGPNTGVYTYHNQCGWDGYWYNGKYRDHFRFKDSITNQYAYKHAGNYDPYTIQNSDYTTHFAGIVCIQDDPPGPLDWMITEDECDGFKQSGHDGQFWYAVSRKTVFDPYYDYQCPAGYRWATTQEGYAAFNQSLNQGYTYHNHCGWNGYDMHNNGLTRYYFLFSDSYKGATTQAYKHAGNGEMYTVQFDLGQPNFGNFAGIVCIDEDYVPADTDWMETDDSCDGFRQSTWDPRFRYAVSKSSTWDKGATYTCPTGYHWASTAEVDAAFEASDPGDQYIYHAQCGWSGYNWKGVDRRYFRMSDSHLNDRYIHAGNYDTYRGSTNSTTGQFAGIICMEDGDPDYPTPGTTDWMQTDDDCQGFRESSWHPDVYYAVARQNIWDPTATYQCPSGFHWASSTEYGTLHDGANTAYYKYSGQCGWSGYYWHGRYRWHFRFSDSHLNNRYAHAQYGDPHTWLVSADPTGFGGTVCIRDTPDPSPTAWMNTNDNCGGFKQSTFDERVYYAVSRDDVWDPSQVYTCPSGYHWMSTAEGEAIFTTANPNSGGHVYYNQCGWNQYNWQQMTRYYFRFSDSNVTTAYKHAGNHDPHQVEYSSTATQFAGILCMKDSVEPTEWMNTTDNCGGFRQSVSDSDVYYAVSQGNVWDPTRVYECPAGFHWASTAEGDARFEGSPTFGTLTYNDMCGWSGYNWNDAWSIGCTSYGQVGCGSTYASPSPTMNQLKEDPALFASGCDECEKFYATACNPSVSAQFDGAGSCDGITEAHWANDQNYDDCYVSPTDFGGYPFGLKAGQLIDHCNDEGVCCGDNKLQNFTRYRLYFRFSDSDVTNAYKHAGNHDNHALEYSSALTEFAGIVCIED